jgi:uncharacterized protein (UPF0332 family)
VAEKCLEIKAYNAGVTRAYYSAFLWIKGYLIDNHFDYEDFLRQKGSYDRVFSHSTIQAAIATCLLENGKKPADVYKLFVLSNLYKNRQKADYRQENIIEAELKNSLNDLDTILSVVT